MKFVELKEDELLNISGGINWSMVGLCTAGFTAGGALIGSIAGGQAFLGGLLGSHYGASVCIGGAAW